MTPRFQPYIETKQEIHELREWTRREAARHYVRLRREHASVPTRPVASARRTSRIRVGGSDSGFDPWLEVDATALRHNVAEVSRLANGRPVLAVVKNNAYGLGDTIVAPVLASCKEVVGIACVRPAEALAIRGSGVRKPMLLLSEVAADEAAEMLNAQVMLSVWLQDAVARLATLAARLGRPIPVHLFVDTGLNREGMPYRKALPWIQEAARSPSVRIKGTFHMFVHNVEYDRIQHERFMGLVEAARSNGIQLGTLHAAPSFELFHLPETHLDMVRIANAIVGNYPSPGLERQASLKPVFHLRARVVRVEEMQPGESAGFGRGFLPDHRTWIALLPIGHTDGYPFAAAGTCQVLISGRTYPVVPAGVASAHTIVDIGPEKTVSVGDVATLIGGDHPAIDPLAVAANCKLPFQQMIAKFSALLPRRLVS